MNAGAPPIEISAFIALNLGIVVFFLGQRLTQAVSVLREYSIPEPVSGGLLVAIATLAVHLATGRPVTFDLAARDALLIYFFTIVGLNARLSDLVAGGRPLALLLVMTVAFMVVQNVVGIGAAVVGGLPPQAGVLLGTASFIGGHGTAIAWGPVVDAEFAVAGGTELGIAAATIGLILASLVGGPIAKRLIERNRLTPDAPPRDVFVLPQEPRALRFDHVDLMRSLLAVHLAIVIGIAAYELLEELGVMLPRFVPCLLSAIVLSNTVPRIAPRLSWPARTPATTVLSDFSLSVFLAMSLMSMDLWTLSQAAGVLALTAVAQTAAAVAFILLVFFRVMGRDYFAAVLAAGFAGFTLGATPTAVANMGAVTKRYGACSLAFIVLPLVSAFFVDITNALMIQAILSF
ncbi:sodium/glutamate symporter [Acuticoccus sp. I52.16.1]|uniref:sodium/glutamate symporter n=1 Tax=Acuticoccus sp. I52.16.1 TaxID=2928472 RepID=UPI001FD57300|nr:sodium/glutamate symporter [Acuticoccus sp. I52.16.1]UOM34889.1 sodium/glutamate symporter [Acuticoccus sp. I52.16.1]